MRDDPRDFIDPDEGYRKNEPAPFFTHGEPCENCGTACDSGTRVWIPGFNYWACDQCAEESRIVIFAEENCPTLYAAIERSRRVVEVQQAYQKHKESCPNCNPKIKITGLPVRRSLTPKGADGTGQRKEAA